MKFNKRISLIIVMVLSISICITNVAGLITAVKAADFEDFLEDFRDNGPDDDPDDWPDIQPDQGAMPQQPDQSENPQQSEQKDDNEEERRRQEEALEEAQRIAEEADRQAKEAAAREAEEAARKAQEEEIARQVEATRKQQEAEEAARQEEAARRAEEEAEKQRVYEEEARKADEAARKQAEEEAAAEAKRMAEEEARKAREAAEKAKQEEEAKKAAEEYTYGLRIQKDGGAITDIILTGSVGKGDSLVFSAVNMGNTDIDIVYGISNSSADVFKLSLVEGSTALAQGNMSKFMIELRASAPVGKYKATVFLKDKKDDKNKFTQYINVYAEVTSSSRVTGISIYPREITLAKGGKCEFHAEVQGENIDPSVIYSLSGAKTAGTYINGDGVLYIDAKETAGNLTVTATSVMDHSFSASSGVGVQSNSYNVTVSPEPLEGGIVTGGGAVVQGGSVTLSAVPQKNYYFEGWKRDGKIVSTATNYTINDVQFNINVIASFKQNYVTVNASSNNTSAGSVVGGGRVTYGGQTTLSAKAYDGYVFLGWTEGDNIISKDAYIELKNLTVDRNITARFAKTTYKISLTCSPYEGGKVYGDGTYKLGESAKIKAEPASGFRFYGWTVNDQTVSRDREFKIDKVEKDYCFNAVFIDERVRTHTVTAGVATTGGTISPCGVSTYARGSSVTYNITPKPGFAILAVAVDGVQVGPVSTYILPDIREDHQIAAAFVQTDAGVNAAKEAAKSGNNEDVQTRKVQKVYKEEVPEVTDEEHVVDLEDAVNGTAGDDFVAEMDLTEIEIPSDEDLEMIVEIAPETTNSVLTRLGMSKEEAADYLNSGNKSSVINAAFYEGSFDAFVDNQYAPPSAIPDYHALTREELEQTAEEEIYPCIPNFSAVVDSIMTPGDVMEIVDGGHANVTVSLTNIDNTIDEDSKKIISRAVGQKPLKYFDLTVMKMVGGAATNIKELIEPMEVVIEIPDDIYKSGRVYSIIRVHNGEVSVLPDLDDDPKTITFRTDKFSAYAISEEKASARKIIVWFAVGGFISFAIALTSFLMLTHHHVKTRRARRKNAV
ncbi:MAG: hypothetical protein K6E53_13450 [Lachnospiraceae bacterium]|nr:hypothetical protein [Lachnospiraceae bacterium]